MEWYYNSSTLQSSQFGSKGDCVTRAIAIVTDKTYSEVCDRMFIEIKKFAATKRSVAVKRDGRACVRSGTTPRNGISKKVYLKYLVEEIGMQWMPNMLIVRAVKCTYLRMNCLRKNLLFNLQSI